jgi:chaperone modulatory protein CbpM
MTSNLDQLSVECGVAVDEIVLWVERRWVRPDRSGDELAFTDADVARLRMVAEFHRDLAIDDDTMPVVLDLLDRLHAARAHLRSVLMAVAELPEPARVRVLHQLQGEVKS